MVSVDLSYVPVRSEDILARVNPDQNISLMNLQNVNDLYMIDGLAAEIWKLIDDKRPLQEVADMIIAKHHPPLEQFYQDLHAFIAKLVEEKILKSRQ